MHIKASYLNTVCDAAYATVMTLHHILRAGWLRSPDVISQRLASPLSSSFQDAIITIEYAARTSITKEILV